MLILIISFISLKRNRGSLDIANEVWGTKSHDELCKELKKKGQYLVCGKAKWNYENHKALEGKMSKVSDEKERLSYL